MFLVGGGGGDDDKKVFKNARYSGSTVACVIQADWHMLMHFQMDLTTIF